MMKLTRVERWMLANQFRILEKLYPDEAKWLAERREAIESGYELQYSHFAEHIDDEGLSEAQCREVLNILSMHRALTFSYRDLADKSGIEERRIQFAGFDGNNETALMGYTRWYCDSELGRFKELNRVEDFNSHMPMLGRYRAMLSEWENSQDKNTLTKEDILRITGVRA